MEDEDNGDEFWLVAELRQLKRGGSSGGFSSSSRSRSYGNCYGDRCDNMGGSTESAIIVGSVIGGCCFILLCYIFIKWCQQKRKDAKKAERRKKRKNRI